jgi:Na+/H+-translocating membrane pyrophosphatase
VLAVFGIVVVVLTSRVGQKGDPNETEIWNWKVGGLTLASFLVGATTSIISGYIGMMVAVYANARTTVCAVPDGPVGWKGAFNCAFRAGAVTGFSLCGLAITIRKPLLPFSPPPPPPPHHHHSRQSR